MKNIDLNKYQEFVDAVTSNESKSNDDFTGKDANEIGSMAVKESLEEYEKIEFIQTYVQTI